VGLVETQTAKIDLPPEGLRLESGARLPELELAYETYGTVSRDGDNVVYICHALTGDAHVAGRHAADDPAPGWWDEMVGPGKGIDTDYYFVVCANILGGCKGTTGPGSTDPRTGKPYGSAFPPVTIGDMVHAQCLLLRQLGIERLAAVIGGSLGGMQVLEWSIRYPEMVGRAICIASGACLSTQALAFDVVSRRVITGDPDWQAGDYYHTGRTPETGLAQARMIGHITYLSPEMMAQKFGRGKRTQADADGREQTSFEVESYLQHQGRKLVERFDANSYLHITRAMDEYDLVERFGSLEQALAPVRAKFLVVALGSDWLFPPEQSIGIADALVRSGKSVSYCMLHAPHGHDAFLVDIAHLREVVRAFLPWVQREPQHAPLPAETPGTGLHRADFRLISEMIRPNSRVLDLGCGDGELLSILAQERGARGFGIDIELAHVICVVDRGHDVFQGDLDQGLAIVPDQAYDYAILGQTLQVVRKPRLVLREMLRVAKEGIVTFPNLAKWSHRLRLGLKGRIPKSRSLPFEWYETPYIHLTTRRDFIDLCDRDNIEILDMVCIPDQPIDRLLVSMGWCGLGADRIVARIARRAQARHGRGNPACRKRPG